ncbi:hypothetical protein JXA84_08060 [candidate division WOR-3 bacterium]|nr:hypothetical protein [candidate division WOR-3 bacterium]
MRNRKIFLVLFLLANCSSLLFSQGQLIWGPVTPATQDTCGLYGVCYNTNNDRIYYLNIYRNLIYIAGSDQAMTSYGTIPAPNGMTHFTDITFCGHDNTFWLVNCSNDMAYHIDTLGNILGSFACPATTYASGITYFENTGTLFFVDRMANSPHYIYETDTMGNLLNTMIHPGQGYMGPRCLGSIQAGYSSRLINVFTYFNSVNGLDSSSVFLMDPGSGSLESQFRFSCSGNDNIRGVEFDPRDGSLWITNFADG